MGVFSERQRSIAIGESSAAAVQLPLVGRVA